MSAPRWRILPEERTVMYSPAWFRPVDVFTQAAPIGPLRIFLDLEQDSAWVATEIKAVTTPSGVLAYPGLGREREPLTGPKRSYRLRVESDVYRPLYRAERDGEVFEAYPYNDTNPPAQRAVLILVELAPSVVYRFPAGVPVLYGTVMTEKDTPAADGLVRAQVGAGLPGSPRLERTVTDENGRFALPLRWVPAGLTAVVTAVHQRPDEPHRQGAISVRVPGDLGRSQTIKIRQP